MQNLIKILSHKQLSFKLSVFVLFFCLGFSGVSVSSAYSSERDYNTDSRYTIETAALSKKSIDRKLEHSTNLTQTTNSARYSQSQSHRTLVILVNFPDTLEVPFTRDEAESLIFKSQFNKFMKEQSFGKVDFSGDVFGWVTMNKYASDGCEVEHDILNQFASVNNINLKNYDHYINILNCKEDVANGSSTFGSINTTLGDYSAEVSVTSVYLSLNSALATSYHIDPHVTLPFIWRNLDAVLAHQMGHALRLTHARGLDCGESQISFPCNNLEYGNSFDVMANLQALSLHTNAYNKRQVGWLADNDVITIEQSGIYKLSPLELGVPTDPSLPSPVIGKRLALIKIPGQSKPVYAIERRAASGFDVQLSQGNRSGFYIYKVNSSGISGEAVSLIDTNPSTEDWDNDVLDAALNNALFIDQGAGLTVKKVSESEFRVIIEQVACTRIAPEIQGISKIDGPEIKTLRTTVNNRDLTVCPQSDFITEILPNDILVSNSSANSLGVFSNSQFVTDVSYTIAPGVPLGVYPVEVKTTNLSSGMFDVKTFYVAITESCIYKQPVINTLELLNANTLAFSVTNTNTSPCYATDFLTEILPNPILSVVDSKINELASSGMQFWGTLHFMTEPNTPPGMYQIIIKSTDLSSNLSAEKSIDYIVF